MAVPIGTPVLTAVTSAGLEWDGNQGVTKLRRMLYWSSPFAIYPATYIFRAYPKGPKTVADQMHWTMFFWGNNGVFDWDSGSGNTYYGAHPYPYGAPISAQAWEISAYAQDIPPEDPYDVECAWNQWYTQVFRAERESAAITHHEFYWDWPDTDKVIHYDINDATWADSNPPSPCICVGQAPDNGSEQSWGGYVGWEEYKGIIRGMQFYDAFLSVANITAEIASPGSSRTPWYLNLNPTPTDVTDKSGNGNDPAWDGEARPTLWTAS